MKGALLGPCYSQEEIERHLKDVGANFKVLSEVELLKETSKNIPFPGTYTQHYTALRILIQPYTALHSLTQP